MSKILLAAAMAASVALYDPPRVLEPFGPQAHAIAWKLKSAVTPGWVAGAQRH